VPARLSSVPLTCSEQYDGGGTSLTAAPVDTPPSYVSYTASKLHDTSKATQEIHNDGKLGAK
jgi:hypothetical protein